MKPAALGPGVDRADARLKVTGAAEYAAEVAVANVAYAVIVGSQTARGRVSVVSSKAAETAPGVLRVITHLNAPQLPGAKTKKDPIDRILQLLQDDQVAYNDQPVAVVVADTLERAQAAARLLELRYDSQAPELELAQGLGSAYTPKTAGPRATPDSTRGDVEAGLNNAPVRIEATYSTPVQTHNPMEMHAVTAVWQGPDHLTVYDCSQGIFGDRKKLAAVFGLEESNVRVISRYVGGGFGSKGSPWSHLALGVLAAREVGRPVKLVVTRQQMFSLVGHRPRTIQKLSLASDKQGRLLAMRHEVTSDTSRFDEFSEPSALQTRMLYDCANVATSHRLVRLDIPSPTFMRAPGEASGTYALECALDELAYAAKIDPLELRLRNYATRDLDEDKPFSSKGLRECYRRAADRFGWARRPHEPRRLRDGRFLLGWGMGTATYPARQSAASARATLQKDGRVLVQAGSQDIGTGTYTIMAQIAADTLEMPLENVRFELGDTALPETPVSGGSQTAASTGSAVKMVCLELKKKMAAGGTAANGPITVELKTSEKPERKKYSTHSFGAQFVEVGVDEDTLEIRVRRVVSAFAAGRILNQKTARSQYIGGIVWGIGFALLEHTVRDSRSGRAVTRDLADYHVPVHADVPDIEVLFVEEEDPYVNELGAKGIGEIGITGISAAIANAVFHATGRRVRDLPITLDKLL
ncbi:MAG TPA: xanthine dehydrogenase family protein molybdopterin-binding subunit [Polyangiaceae bacterium]|nr:xanthine dehydrogenase family protein molybdopterin-binding subunit [Polyangiaceae bacterium]